MIFGADGDGRAAEELDRLADMKAGKQKAGTQTSKQTSKQVRKKGGRQENWQARRQVDTRASRQERRIKRLS